MGPRPTLLASILAAALAAGCTTSPGTAPAVDDLSEPAPPADLASVEDTFAARLDGVLEGTWRSAEHRARDAWRNPRETLGFFGIAPGQTVIEITPGAGWYAEILAPLLREDGRYIAALPDPARADTPQGREGRQRGIERLRTKFAEDPSVYGRPAIVTYDPAAPVLGPAGSADLVLTFRNVHNWTMAGTDAAMFEAFFAVLKPGGVLGVVDHRARRADAPHDSGYLHQDYVIGLAERAGFRLVESSEINANPADTTDHPNGVWTLPPTLNVPEGEDRERYRAIGESDRMTLKFVKPAE
ncbi:class I SAM-dependent methyltransferase [Coralloluteibacterium thermophilus]|uniref:Class I SAM-dependent methyltransferase n=1 Tax=Coralloluteibacterium thermophilum TaxID=2707049 RepID=A0ABV9NRI4_9GAMM